MALNTQLQNVSAAMDPGIRIPEGQDSIGALVSGFIGGMQTGDNLSKRRSDKKQLAEKLGRDPTRQEMADAGIQSMPESVARGFAGGRQFLAEMTDPTLGVRMDLMEEQRKALTFDNSLNAQLSRDIGGLLDEFGNLQTSEQRLEFLSRNAGLSVTPQGSRLLNQLSGITGTMMQQESKSLKALMAHNVVKDLADLAANWGANPEDAESINLARKNRSTFQILKIFKDQGKELSALPDNVFNPDGSINMPSLVPELHNASIISSDPLAETKINLEKRRLDLVEQELGVREKAAQARNRGITKEEFILKNAPDLLKSTPGLLSPKEAAQQLGEIYDSVAVDPFGLFD